MCHCTLLWFIQNASTFFSTKAQGKWPFTILLFIMLIKEYLEYVNMAAEAKNGENHGCEPYIKS